MRQPDDEQIREILVAAKTVAIVGLSDNPERSSYGVAEYLKRHYSIIPVNPQISRAFGLVSYPSLSAIPPDVQIDIVNIFRRSEFVPAIVDEAIARKVKCVWMQLGVIHHEAAEEARSNGITVVMDACIAVMHRQLCGDRQ